MKTFKQHLNEAPNYKNYSADRLIKVLERTRKSISTMKKHNPGVTLNNGRAQDLVDRYEEIRDIMKMNFYPEWKAWCDKKNIDRTHNAYDLFA